MKNKKEILEPLIPSFDREDRYIRFPLCLLQETYKDPAKGLNLILNYGIVLAAKEHVSIDSCREKEAGCQLIYDYYHNPDLIQLNLSNMMKDYIESLLSGKNQNNGII